LAGLSRRGAGSTDTLTPRSFYANGVPNEKVRHKVRLLFNEAMHIVDRGNGCFDRRVSWTVQ